MGDGVVRNRGAHAKYQPRRTYAIPTRILVDSAYVLIFPIRETMKAMEVCKGMSALVSAQKAANWYKRESLAVKYLFPKLHAVNVVVEQKCLAYSHDITRENIYVTTICLPMLMCVSCNKIL